MKLVKDELIKAMKDGEIEPEEAIKKFEQSLSMPVKRTYIPPTIEDVQGIYATNVQLRKRALKSQIPFINPGVGADFKLTQGLVLIGGVSGQGKSTTYANLIAGFVEHVETKRALLITNEENTASVYDRVACVILKYSFRDYYQDVLQASKQDEVRDLSHEIMRRVVVEEGSEKYDMTCLEDVQAALVHAAEGGYGMAGIDYLQTVTWSRENPDLEPVQVSKKLGFFLKDYGRKVEIPIIVFCQLKPNSEAPDLASRIQNDRTIYNHAFVVIEVIPDFDAGTTKFHWHKDRFGGIQNQEIEMQYIGGRFEPMGGL